MAVPVPYVQRHLKTGRLSFRRVYPPELRPFIDSKGAASPSELKKSLGVKVLSEPGAMVRYQAAAAEYERVIAKARKAKARREGLATDDAAEGPSGCVRALDAETIAYLVQTYERDQFEAIEAALRKGDPANLQRRSSYWELHHDDWREWQREWDFDNIEEYWEQTARNLLGVAGYAVSPDELGSIEALCRALNAKAIEIAPKAIERLQGHWVPLPAKPVRPEVSSRSFEQIVLGILDSPICAVGYPTREGTRTALRYLREAHGPLTPQEITKAKVTEHLNLLAQKPARLPKGEQGLPLRKVVELYKDREDVKRLSVKTIEQQLIFLSSMWGKAQDAGHIPEALANPFKRKELAKRQRGSPKALFDLNEVKAILSLDIFTEGVRPAGGKGEASYWIPLLLLWTGARPEEIAQLMVQDVRQDADGRWTLTITDEGEHPHKGRRRLKTTEKETGRRTFLIPQPLLSLNFIGYVAHLKQTGEKALFPHLRTKGARGYLYAGWSTWWSKYLLAKRVLPPTGGFRPMREFRDYWATVARECGIPKEAHVYLMGHAPQDINDDYGRREAYGREMDKLRFVGLEDTLARVKPWEPID